MQIREQSRTQSAVHEITDGMLVKQTLAGDERAFEKLVQRYHVPLFNFICHCLGIMIWRVMSPSTSSSSYIFPCQRCAQQSH